jgi:hypothetical protein
MVPVALYLTPPEFKDLELEEIVELVAANAFREIDGPDVTTELSVGWTAPGDYMNVGPGAFALSAPCPLAEENRVLRRVAEAYTTLNLLVNMARPEWATEQETPAECLAWVTDMKVAEDEVQAALAEAKAKGVM